MPLGLSRCADYAVRAVLDIAERGPAPMGEIARRRQVPPAFLAKVVRNLVRGRILRSARGPGGGLALGRPAGELSLLDILEAADGPVTLNRCVPGGGGCPLMRRCPARRVWLRLQRVLTEELRSITVGGLAAAEMEGERANGQGARREAPPGRRRPQRAAPGGEEGQPC